MKKDKLVVTSLATELLDDVFISYKKNLTDLSKKIIVVTPIQKYEML